jgi:hypothetical protein
MVYRIGNKDYTEKDIVKLAAEHKKLGIISGATVIAASLAKDDNKTTADKKSAEA